MIRKAYKDSISSKVLTVTHETREQLKNSAEELKNLFKKKEKELPSNDPYEEIKKLKDLLDMGIISQEEFDTKKKELLNI